jgi:hypothetical protein
MDQLKKLKEEYIELEEALVADNQIEIIDAIGDIQVVLNVICMQLSYDYDTCLELAYEEIKDRKGKMVDGVFVKETKTSSQLMRELLDDSTICIKCVDKSNCYREDLKSCDSFKLPKKVKEEKTTPDCYGSYVLVCGELAFLCSHKSNCKKETESK